MKTFSIRLLVILFTISIFSCSKTEEIVPVPTPASSDFSFIKVEIESSKRIELECPEDATILLGKRMEAAYMCPSL